MRKDDVNIVVKVGVWDGDMIRGNSGFEVAVEVVEDVDTEFLVDCYKEACAKAVQAFKTTNATLDALANGKITNVRKI